jgi:hypothetical protein
MGWRWNRQLHPRQLKGTSSRTRIIAGVLLSAHRGPMPLYARIVYCYPQLGCEGVPAPSIPLCSCINPPAPRIRLAMEVGWPGKLLGGSPTDITQPTEATPTTLSYPTSIQVAVLCITSTLSQGMNYRYLPPLHHITSMYSM